MLVGAEDIPQIALMGLVVEASFTIELIKPVLRNLESVPVKLFGRSEFKLSGCSLSDAIQRELTPAWK